MANEIIKKYLVDGYNKVTATHSYIFGWAEQGVIVGYKVMDAEKLLAWITTTDTASKKNGGTVQLKFKPNKAQKLMIATEAVEVKIICTEEYFENIRANSTGKEKNRGYIFERLACEAFELEQNTKSNAKATDCGDGRSADGIEYQIKFNTATFIDEKTLKNFLK